MQYFIEYGKRTGNTYPGEGKDKTTDGSKDDASHQEEGNVLWPELDINIKPQPMDSYLHPLGDWVLPSHSIKYDIYKTLK